MHLREQTGIVLLMKKQGKNKAAVTGRKQEERCSTGLMSGLGLLLSS